MSFSYSGDPSKSKKDQVRFLLRDMVAPGILTDEEIFFLIESYSDPILAASNGAQVVAGRYASLVDKTVGPLSIRYGELSKRYEDLADRLIGIRQQGGSGKEFAIRAFTTQKSQTPYFTLGIHDYYKAIEPEISLIESLLLPTEEQNESVGSELIAYAGAPYSMVFEYRDDDGNLQPTELFRARAQISAHDNISALLVDVLSTTPGSGLTKTDPGVITWSLSAAQTAGLPYWCVYEVQLEELANTVNRLPIANGSFLVKPQVIPDA